MCTLFDVEVVKKEQTIVLDNIEIELLDSNLSELELKIFKKGKLGTLIYIKKERLEQIL